ncbi:BUD13 isoform X1 [Aphis craccivora]|uniref:BUD13 isoform X1 n=1 Tax=Aphis craccivora TaxID=307492 RepID=A0A6G0YKR1_APHCR|nr:BUD13 isoform X1 [Aphis craccivora]
MSFLTYRKHLEPVEPTIYIPCLEHSSPFPDVRYADDQDLKNLLMSKIRDEDLMFDYLFYKNKRSGAEMVMV